MVAPLKVHSIAPQTWYLQEMRTDVNSHASLTQTNQGKHSWGDDRVNDVSSWGRLPPEYYLFDSLGESCYSSDRYRLPCREQRDHLSNPNHMTR
jgi:hypothetical protein